MQKVRARPNQAGPPDSLATERKNRPGEIPGAVSFSWLLQAALLAITGGYDQGHNCSKPGNADGGGGQHDSSSPLFPHEAAWVPPHPAGRDIQYTAGRPLPSEPTVHAASARCNCPTVTFPGQVATR